MDREKIYSWRRSDRLWISMELKEKQDKNASITQQIIIYALLILNAVHSAYVLNYAPKIGAFHITICTVFGIVLAVFSFWAVVKCMNMLLKKEGKTGINIILLLLVVLLTILGISSIIPYVRDFFGDSKTVTTDKYMVVRDHLYFIDDEGNDIYLVIPEDMAETFKSKDNYEYDPEKNLLQYYDPINITYYPNSKVIIRENN